MDLSFGGYVFYVVDGFVGKLVVQLMLYFSIYIFVTWLS
jgi:hypothetical protein